MTCRCGEVFDSHRLATPWSMFRTSRPARTTLTGGRGGIWVLRAGVSICAPKV
jgi:hypothetical protein